MDSSVSNMDVVSIASSPMKLAVSKQVSSCIDVVNGVSQNCTHIVDAITSSNQSIAKSIYLSGTNINNSILGLDSKTSESLNSLSSDITEAIFQSSDKSSATAILFAVFVAFVGAFSAFLFNHYHWRVVRKTNKTYGVGAELIGSIQELESEALKYWVSSYDHNRNEEILILEIRIKSIILRINTQTIALIEVSNNRTIKGKKGQINKFPSEVYDLVTGGSFESKSRKSSKSKAMRIAKLCSAARADITSVIIHL